MTFRFVSLTFVALLFVQIDWSAVFTWVVFSFAFFYAIYICKYCVGQELSLTTFKNLGICCYTELECFFEVSLEESREDSDIPSKEIVSRSSP